MSEMWFWDIHPNAENPDLINLGNYRALRTCTLAPASSSASDPGPINCTK